MFGGEERLEDAIADLVGYTRAAVEHAMRQVSPARVMTTMGPVPTVA